MLPREWGEVLFFLYQKKKKKCKGQLLFVIEGNKLSSHSCPQIFIARVRGTGRREEAELTFAQDPTGIKGRERAPLPHTNKANGL